jgi:hypothetical protein
VHWRAKSRVSGPQKNRRSFVGGSDAWIIMGDDEQAFVARKLGFVSPISNH